MKNIKGFENYTITQDGVVTNTNTRKSLKVTDGKLKLTKDGERFTVHIVDLIHSNYNKIIFNEFIGKPTNTHSAKESYTNDSGENCLRFFFEDFTCYDVNRQEFLDVKKLIEEDESILIFLKDNLPKAWQEYQAEQRALKVDGINYKSLEEYPGLAISKDGRILKIEDATDVFINSRGFARCRVGDKLLVVKVDKVFPKYFS